MVHPRNVAVIPRDFCRFYLHVETNNSFIVPFCLSAIIFYSFVETINNEKLTCDLAIYLRKYSESGSERTTGSNYWTQRRKNQVNIIDKTFFFLAQISKT